MSNPIPGSMNLKKVQLNQQVGIIKFNYPQVRSRQSKEPLQKKNQTKMI